MTYTGTNGVLSPEETGTLSFFDVARISEKLEGMTAEEIIEWAHRHFGRRVAILTAFQQAGCMLCHKVYEMGLADKIDVIFVDTGVNFPETVETVDRIEKEYGFNVIRLHPERTMAQQTEEEGVLYLDKEGQERCCFMRKKLPLQQIKGRYDALLGSLRRESGGRRAQTPPVAMDKELSLLRIHPFYDLSKEEMKAYIEEHDVIINPLHAQGFPTVSCNRCTTPVIPGESERAGRWRHLNNVTYCKINPTDSAKVHENEETIEIQRESVERIRKIAI